MTNKVTAFDGATGENFGCSVDFIDANNVVIGAEKHKVSGSKKGAAYLFEYDSGTSQWVKNTVTDQIIATDGASYDFYGASVSGDGDNIITGAYRSDPSGMSAAGAGYIYDISASILPVELVSFEAELVDKQVYLTWATASEHNNDGFIVQRSEDGFNWEDLGWVDGMGDSDKLVEYAYTDRHPNSNTNYYRLNQIDYDGKNEYSDIVSIFIKIQSDFTIFPNPTSDYIHLAHSFDFEDVKSIQLFDVMGRQVKKFSLSNGALSVANIPPGCYYLVLNIGGEMLHKSIQIE
ncbi:MAG TPA: T9SS type A sorting domain-containing protein [Saprospiraceae bacterium]|nr:T9SS type A sorting domain-containing protein [Saprospiraceae bacterium]